MNESSRNGVVTVDGDTVTLTFVRRLRHSVADVWEALTDPERRAAWFGSMTIDPRQGGPYEMVADGPPVPPAMRRVTGRVLVWDPPRVLELEWNQGIIGETVVRYELTPDGDETILTFIHSGLSPSNGQGFVPGQHAYLDRLEAHLDGEPLPDWATRYGEVQGEYAPR